MLKARQEKNNISNILAIHFFLSLDAGRKHTTLLHYEPISPLINAWLPVNYEHFLALIFTDD